MSGSKHFDKIAWTVTALMLVVTIIFMNGASFGIEAMPSSMGYEDRLFDNTRVHTVDIVMNDWEKFIDDAMNEEYYTAAVVIDGESYKNVGIRAKGNTSLSTVAALNSERYSFKIEFDHYDDSITYHGLDKLCLNNLIQDNTMMKDYLTYTMMREYGIDTPLCSYVYITVNGEDWGLYLAVEGVEEAFLERNYGSDYGNLYKPDTAMGGGMDMGEMDMSNIDIDSIMGSMGSADSSETGMPDMSAMLGGDMGGMMGGFSISIDEATVREAFEKLELDDSLLDNIDFENITMETLTTLMTSVDTTELMELMQILMQDIMGGGISMGSAEVKLQYIDDDPDSYSGIWSSAKTAITKADKTRLIESLRKLSAGEDLESVLDIDQVIRYFVVHNYVCNDDSYTGMMIHNYYLYEEDGQLAMIPWDYNLGFGTMVGGDATGVVNTPIDMPVAGGTDDRPMINWIYENPEYTELYHQYFEEFLNTVDIQGIIDSAYEMIAPYVEKDPTSFCTFEEFEQAAETLRQFCALRSESISMQLETGETVNEMDYVDASAIQLNDMGTMMNMMSDASSMMDMESIMGMMGGDMSGISDMMGAMSGGMSDGMDVSQILEMMGGNLPDGFSEEMLAGMTGEMPEGMDMSQILGSMGGGMMSMFSGLIWIAASILILAVGLIIAKKYRRWA